MWEYVFEDGDEELTSRTRTHAPDIVCVIGAQNLLEATRRVAITPRVNTPTNLVLQNSTLIDKSFMESRFLRSSQEPRFHVIKDLFNF